MPRTDDADVRWFLDEVHRHDSSLKNYVKRSFPAVRDVEDVVQESYLRVWRRQMVRPIADVTGSVKASVKGFLFQVARRLALDTIRHDRASPVDATVEFEAVAGTDAGASLRERVDAAQEFQLVLEAMDRLPARCREVMILRKLKGLDAAETAKALGISEETVHVQTRRGLQKVQDYLREAGIMTERTR